MWTSVRAAQATYPHAGIDQERALISRRDARQIAATSVPQGIRQAVVPLQKGSRACAAVPTSG